MPEGIHISVCDNQISWTVDSQEASAVDVMALMATTLIDMYAYYFESPTRPPLPIADGRVCIEMKGDTFAVAYRPEGDAWAALGMIQAAIVGLNREMNAPDFDPLEGLLGAIYLGEK